MAVALEPAQVAHIKNAQLNFLRRGGIFEMPLTMLRTQGVIDEDYVYREYPKIIRISRGMQTLHRSFYRAARHRRSLKMHGRACFSAAAPWASLPTPHGQPCVCGASWATPWTRRPQAMPWRSLKLNWHL